MILSRNIQNHVVRGFSFIKIGVGTKVSFICYYSLVLLAPYGIRPRPDRGTIRANPHSAMCNIQNRCARSNLDTPNTRGTCLRVCPGTVVFERLASPNKLDFRLTMRRSAGTGQPGADALVIDVKGARLEGESYSSTIGDNETVDITFSTQVGGANDTSNGIFMRGSYDKWRTMPYWCLGDAKNKQGSWSGTGGVFNSIR